MAVLALVTVILGLFVVRPLLSNNAVANMPDVPALPPGSTDIPDMRGANDDLETGEFELPEFPVISDFADDAGGVPALGIQRPTSDDPVDRLRSMIGERQEETVEILRSWLEDKEESV
jgi:flagellar M-ring protein FliF